MSCIYCENELTSGDVHNTCKQCKDLQEEGRKEWLFRPQVSGWVCPKCGSVYGTSVLECFRCNSNQGENLKGVITT